MTKPNTHYPTWEKRYREYIEQGDDILIAWHKAHLDMGLGQEEYDRLDDKMKEKVDNGRIRD
jgi:hypothetical protein